MVSLCLEAVKLQPSLVTCKDWSQHLNDGGFVGILMKWLIYLQVKKEPQEPKEADSADNPHTPHLPDLEGIYTICKLHVFKIVSVNLCYNLHFNKI